MSAPYQYPTDLSDDQWAFLQPYLPESTWQPGWTRTTPMRFAMCYQWYFVPQQDGLSVAHDSQRLWQLEHHL